MCESKNRRNLSVKFGFMIYLNLLALIVACGEQIEKGENTFAPSRENNASKNSGRYGSQNTYVESERPQIVISVEASNLSSEVNVDYIQSQEDSNTPRVAEMLLSYSINLQYVASQKGDAITNAGKQLIVQNLPDQNRLRMVILASDNINELKTGRLATLTFKKTNDEEATVRILTDKPIFAPEEANEGLLVSDPLTF